MTNIANIRKLAETIANEVIAETLIGDHKHQAAKREFYQHVARAVSLDEAIIEASKPERDGDGTASYRYDAAKLADFISYYKENHKWIRGLFKSCPTPAQLSKNPIRYIGSWLKNMGLSQARVGKNERGTYSLVLEPLKARADIIKKRAWPRPITFKGLVH